MHFKKKTFNKFLLAIPFLVLLIGMVSAEYSLTDTVLTNSPYNNLTINFTTTQTGLVDSFIIEQNSIYLQNFRRSGSEYITMNLTSTNKNYTGYDLPYFVQSTLNAHSISSNLTDTLANLTVSMNTYSCNVQSLVITNGTYIRSVASPGCIDTSGKPVTTFVLDQLGPEGVNITEIDFGSGTGAGGNGAGDQTATNATNTTIQSNSTTQTNTVEGSILTIKGWLAIPIVMFGLIVLVIYLIITNSSTVIIKRSK